MIDYLIYGVIVYHCLGGALFMAAFQEGKLDGNQHPRYLWAFLPLWPLVFIVGKRRPK